MAKARYGVEVLWNTGEREQLKEGDHAALFRTRKEANKFILFMKVGMEGYQSIHAVLVHVMEEGEVERMWRGGCSEMNRLYGSHQCGKDEEK